MLFDPAQTRALSLPLSLPAADGNLNSANLAVEITEGQGPTFMWLCGYAGDMNGTKASYFKHQCEAWSFRLVRFDYRGCGQSAGDRSTLTISDYLADAKAVLTQATDGPVILIGSSLGGWLSLRLMREFPNRIAGFIGIAAAPDFTKGYESSERPADAPAIYQPLIDDGNAHHLVLHEPIAFTGPVALLHGQRDQSVPWRISLQIADKLQSAAVSIHLIKDGDHSLSRADDLELLWQVANNMREKIIGPVQAMPAELGTEDDITV